MKHFQPLPVSIVLCALLTILCRVCLGSDNNANDWWQPESSEHLTWQWQLNTGNIDTSLDVDVYDVDLFDTPQSKIDYLHAKGKKVICYFSAGSWEEWREDAGDFPESVKGKELDGWSGERWLDIRSIDKIGPIMQRRLAFAVAKKCDAVEPDNIDGYTNDTGFAITAQDQLEYNRWLAEQAHQRHLSIGLKNDIDQVVELVDYFDWALNEQCYQYEECDAYEIFVNRDKAVFGVEYTGNPENFCPRANASGYSWIKKNINLDAWRIGCEDYLTYLPGDTDSDGDVDGLDLASVASGNPPVELQAFAVNFGKTKN